MGRLSKAEFTVTLLFCCFGLTLQDKTLVTFNVGLTRTVPLYEERMVPVVEALKKETADVVCIQEAWNGIDVNNIVDGVKSGYKYSYSLLHQSDGSIKTGAACNQSVTNTFNCFKDKCFTAKNAVEMINCMIDQCSLMDLEQSCRTCVMLSAPSVEIMNKDCVTAGFDFNINGLLLLSREPLSSISLTDFEPNVAQLAPRAYIKAKVNGIGEIICTHLTVDLGPVYLESNLDKYGSWQKQNLGEVKTLLEEIIDKNKIILMGTLNTGPTIQNKSVVGDFPESYKELTSNGLSSGYVDVDGECNLCLGNPFNEGYISHSSIANHIMTKGYTVKSARRCYTENITGKEYPLSYHYGVEITI